MNRLEGFFEKKKVKISSYIAHYIGLADLSALHIEIEYRPKPHRLTSPTPTTIHVLQPRIMAAGKARIQ